MDESGIITLIFLVIQCKSSFKGILGRSFLAKLEALASTIHLKIAYHDKWGAPITMEEDLRVARRIRKEIPKFTLTLTSRDREEIDIDARKSEIRLSFDDEFKFVELGDNPNISIKIRYGLSPM